MQTQHFQPDRTRTGGAWQEPGHVPRLAPRQLFHAGGWNTIPTCLGGYSAVHGTHRQIAIHISTSECPNQRALEIFLWYYPTMTQGNFDAKTNLGPRNHRFGRCATAAEPWTQQANQPSQGVP